MVNDHKEEPKRGSGMSTRVCKHQGHETVATIAEKAKGIRIEMEPLDTGSWRLLVLVEGSGRGLWQKRAQRGKQGSESSKG